MIRGDEFVDEIDGLSALTRIKDERYLTVFRGRLAVDGSRELVQLRTPSVAPDQELTDAFTRRARQWEQLSTHPNVAQVYDVGATPRPWVLVRDQPNAFASARHDMTVSSACEVVVDVAEALRNASLYNFSHGNLTPRHVRITMDGTVLVDDWGLIRTIATHTDGSYVTGYTAPEQIDDAVTATLDETDVYALGGLAYYAVTGKPPFSADRRAILEGTLVSPSDTVQELPPVVDETIRTALSRTPSARHDGIYAFAVAFREAVQEIDDIPITPDRTAGDVESPFDRIRRLDGVDVSIADTLWTAGYRTIDDIAETPRKELATTTGLGQAQAARIKAAVGHTAETDDPDSAEGEEAGAATATQSTNFDQGMPEGGRTAMDNLFTEQSDTPEADANDQKERDPSEIASAAQGNVDEQQLVGTESSNRPLWKHLRADEQPHYYFDNVNKGLRFTNPDWEDKETPYNVGLAHPGKRYLLVTDQRVLFVGGEPEGSDTVEGFPYTELVDSDAEWGWTKTRLTVEHVDGRSISFFDGGGQAAHIEDAGEYVAQRIAETPAQAETDESTAEQQPSAETTDSPDETGADGGKSVASVSGVDEERAEALRDLGYETVSDLQDATQDDLADVPGIGNALAARIVFAVGSGDVLEGAEGGANTETVPTESTTPDDATPGETDHTPDAEEMTTTEADDDRTPAEIASAARGNVTEAALTESDSSRPLWKYLDDGEQPQYVFEHVKKGLRFTRSDWDSKRTPYNVGWSHSGQRYLLVTDRRILFVGGEPDGSDTVVGFPYTDLVDVDANWGLTKGRLTVEHVDGRSISFFDGGGEAKHVEDAGEYIAKRLAEATDTAATSPDADTQEETSDEGSPDSATQSDETPGPSAERQRSGADGRREPASHTDQTGESAEGTSTAPDSDGDTEANAESRAAADESDTNVRDTATEGSNTDSSDGEPQLRYCPACGTNLQEFGKQPEFCPSCGEDIKKY